MTWAYMRIAIFTAAFMLGLLIFGSGSGSADSSKGPAQTVGETGETRCFDDHFTLVQATVEVHAERQQ